MRLAQHLVFFALVFFVLRAHAQESPSKLDLAKQLVELLQFDEMLRDNVDECVRAHNPHLEAAAVYKSQPERFEGLTPDSPYWQEIEAIYSRFQQKVCRYPGGDDPASYFAQQFAERATEDDIRAAISFYSSPTGHRLQTVTRDVNKDFQADAAKLTRRTYEEAQDQYPKEVRAVLTKFHEGQKK